jgi:hypothetical protein
MSLAYLGGRVRNGKPKETGKRILETGPELEWSRQPEDDLRRAARISAGTRFCPQNLMFRKLSTPKYTLINVEKHLECIVSEPKAQRTNDPPTASGTLRSCLATTQFQHN